MTEFRCNPPILQGPLATISRKVRDLAISLQNEPGVLSEPFKASLASKLLLRLKPYAADAEPLLENLASSHLPGERLCAILFKRILISDRKVIDPADPVFLTKFVGDIDGLNGYAVKTIEEILSKNRVKPPEEGFE